MTGPTFEDGPNVPAPFEKYAVWYDLFYQDKDYDGEVRYLIHLAERWTPSLRSWLDVGCGTGKHLGLLHENGFAVEGLDVSPEMIAHARARYPLIPFHIGSIQNVRLTGDRDVVSMLFHGINYQTSDDALRAALNGLTAHLSSSGVLIFDFWQREGVMNDPPAKRIRKVETDGRTLFRLSHPTEWHDGQLITVHFEFRWDSPEGELAHQEWHVLRPYDPQHLETLLRERGLKVWTCEAWREDRPLRASDWYGVLCAGRKARA